MCLHPHAAGAIGGDNEGRSRPKGAIKIHLTVDALGMPVRAVITDDLRADCKEAIPPIQNLPCKVLLADRGYDSDEIVEHAKNSGIQLIIPPKKNRKVQRKYDENLDKNAIASKTLSFD